MEQNNISSAKEQNTSVSSLIILTIYQGNVNCICLSKIVLSSFFKKTATTPLEKLTPASFIIHIGHKCH